MGDHLLPILDHLVVGLQKNDVRVAVLGFLGRQHTVVFFEPRVERRVRQRIKDVHRHDRDLRHVGEIHQRLGRIVRVRVEAHDDARRGLDTIFVHRLDGVKNRHAHVLALLHRLESGRVGRFDAEEAVIETGLLHFLENARMPGHVQRGLAGETDIIIAIGPLLPLDQRVQQRLRRLRIADKIVVDKIDGDRAAVSKFIQFGHHLLRRLQPGIAAVKRGDVAELTGERATARELHRAEQIIADLDPVISRCGKLRHRQALDRAVNDLLLRPLDCLVEPLEDTQRRIACFPAMQDVDVRVIVRRRGDRRPAESDHLADVMRPPRDVVNAMALDVHARDKNRVGPLEILRLRAVHVLVDETNFPLLRNQRRDDKNALRWHEALHVAHERERMVERAEAVTVPRKADQDLPFIPRNKLPQS